MESYIVDTCEQLFQTFMAYNMANKTKIGRPWYEKGEALVSNAFNFF